MGPESTSGGIFATLASPRRKLIVSALEYRTSRSWTLAKRLFRCHELSTLLGSSRPMTNSLEDEAERPIPRKRN